MPLDTSSLNCGDHCDFTITDLFDSIHFTRSPGKRTQFAQIAPWTLRTHLSASGLLFHAKIHKLSPLQPRPNDPMILPIGSYKLEVNHELIEN